MSSSTAVVALVSRRYHLVVVAIAFRPAFITIIPVIAPVDYAWLDQVVLPNALLIIFPRRRASRSDLFGSPADHLSAINHVVGKTTTSCTLIPIPISAI